MRHLGVDVAHGSNYSVLSTKHFPKLNAQIELHNFDNNEVLKMCGSLDHALQALNSQYFKTWCLNHTYKKKVKTGWFKSKMVEVKGFHKNNGLSNQEIYDLIMEGRERLQPDTVGHINAIIKIDDRNKKGVLGYTYANSIPQYIYNWFFKSGTFFDVAGNVIHEWMHKLGFTHEFRFNSLRQYTVPYSVGYFVRDYKGQL